MRGWAPEGDEAEARRHHTQEQEAALTASEAAQGPRRAEGCGWRPAIIGGAHVTTGGLVITDETLDAALRAAVEDGRPGKHLDMRRALESLTEVERAVVLARAHGIPWHAVVQQLQDKGIRMQAAALREFRKTARSKLLEGVSG
mgnify:CR=1 FL=1